MAKTIKAEYVHDTISGGMRPNPDYRPKTKRKPTSPNPTTVLTDKVIDYVKSHDQCYAWRTSTKGEYRQSIGRYVSVGLAVGWPDITAIVYGRFVGIEVKRGCDIQSNAQKTVEAEIKAVEGAYLIVSDFDTFKVLFDSYITIKRKRVSK